MSIVRQGEYRWALLILGPGMLCITKHTYLEPHSNVHHQRRVNILGARPLKVEDFLDTAAGVTNSTMWWPRYMDSKELKVELEPVIEWGKWKVTSKALERQEEDDSCRHYAGLYSSLFYPNAQHITWHLRRHNILSLWMTGGESGFVKRAAEKEFIFHTRLPPQLNILFNMQNKRQRKKGGN